MKHSKMRALVASRPARPDVRRALGAILGAAVIGTVASALVTRRRRRRRRLVLSDALPRETWERLHDETVSGIVDQLRAHHGSMPVSLRKKSASHQVPKARDRRRDDDKIDVGGLDRILH